MSESPPKLSLEAYAELLAELGRAGEERDAVLCGHGLSEAEWEALDEHYQAVLERADLPGDANSVPDAVARFSNAFVRGMSTQTLPRLTLEEYAEVVRLTQQGSDIARLLEQRRLSVPEYLDAQAHHLKAMTENPDLRRLFETLLNARK